MRNLQSLLEDVILLLPDEHKNKFNSIKLSVRCSSPENMYIFWNESSQIIADICLTDNGKPEHKWQVALLSLWSTQSIKEICNRCNLVYENL